MISVLILTKNEEHDLASCLASVSWCDDIHVFDSFSEDKTVEIAEKAGAKVMQRKFDGYSSQRNAALVGLNYKHDWIFILDADEQLPANLELNLKKHIQDSSNLVNGFRLRRKDYFGSTWLKHAQISQFYIRLVRVGKARYHREINEVLEVDGKVQDIQEYFNHYPFSKGLGHWINKHNEYSTMEALQWVKEQKGEYKFSFKKAIFSSDFSEKRYHQKGLFYKLPFRPLLKWLYLIIYKRSFLDGRAGIKYATLQAIYEYFIVLKSEQLIENKK